MIPRVPLLPAPRLRKRVQLNCENVTETQLVDTKSLKAPRLVLSHFSRNDRMRT